MACEGYSPERSRREVINLEQNTNTNENKMNPMVIVGVIVAVIVIGAVVLLGRGNSTSTNTNGNATESEGMMAEDNNPANDGEDMVDDTSIMVDETAIEIQGGAFYFEPNEIRVQAGQTVTITLNSVADSPADAERKMMHDFVIDELDVQSEEVVEGESTTFTFTPTEAGEYEFYCSVGQHRANGMFGTLIVE